MATDRILVGIPGPGPAPRDMTRRKTLLVIGLGNNIPSAASKYKNTRHNIGAETLVYFTKEYYATSRLFRTVVEDQKHQVRDPATTNLILNENNKPSPPEEEDPRPNWRDEYKSYRVATLAGGRCKLLLPLTYMNESGKGAQAFANNRANKDFVRLISGHGKRLAPEAVCAVHDELELPVGTCKVKTETRSSRGHNGIKSLIQCLGMDDFVRLQVGVGRPLSREPDLVAKYVLSDFEDGRVKMEVMEAAARSLHDWLLGELFPCAPAAAVRVRRASADDAFVH